MTVISAQLKKAEGAMGAQESRLNQLGAIREGCLEKVTSQLRLEAHIGILHAKGDNGAAMGDTVLREKA